MALIVGVVYEINVGSLDRIEAIGGAEFLVEFRHVRRYNVPQNIMLNAVEHIDQPEPENAHFEEPALDSFEHRQFLAPRLLPNKFICNELFLIAIKLAALTYNQRSIRSKRRAPI